jgi:glutathione S-transferase
LFCQTGPRLQVRSFLFLVDCQKLTSRVVESAAILLHLSDAFPGKLLPSSTTDRAEAYRWLAFIHANIYETLLRFIYADRYTTETSKEALRGIRNAAKARLPDLLAILESQVFKKGTFVVGTSMSAVDYYVFFVSNTLPKLGMAGMLDKVPKLKKHGEMVKKTEVVQRIYDEHYPPASANI